MDRNNKLILIIALPIAVAIIIIAMIGLSASLPAIMSLNSIGDSWTTYSGKGISFDYPSSWTIEEGFTNGEYVVASSSNAENGIRFYLPYPPTQTMYQKYPSLEAYANDIFPKLGMGTVEEGFTERYFNGFPGVAGKLSYIDSMSYLALFHKYDNQLYSFQYYDNENSFDSNESQEIMYKVISSFKFI